jgi:hypothetical protein
MRTFDATLLNEIANDPRVRPAILAPEGPMDLTATVQNPNNVAIVNRWGGFVAIQMTPMLYECHTLFLPEKEGLVEVLALARDAEAFMFTHTQATELITRVADGNRAAHIVASKANFKNFGHQKNLVPGVDCEVMRYAIDDWALTAAITQLEGWTFHSAIADAKRLAGAGDIHEPDVRHDRFVGAALLMAKAGQVMKAFMFYNRAAFIYGYHPIRLLSDSPAVIDTGDAIVGIENGQIEVMQCRSAPPSVQA